MGLLKISRAYSFTARRSVVAEVLFTCLVACASAKAQPLQRESIGVFLPYDMVMPRSGRLLIEGTARGEVGLLPVFAAAQATFPTSSTLFRGEKGTEERAYKFERSVSYYESRGISVLALFDILDWTRPRSSPGANALTDRPELLELNAWQAIVNSGWHKYASPWHPYVRQALSDLLSEFGVAYRQVDGIVLDCHLSYNEILGYSEAARVAYIRFAQIDPIDLTLGSNDEDEERYAQAWCLWREDEMSTFVGELAMAYRRARPGGKVYATGTANYYRWPLGRRNYLLNNWLMWAKNGDIDGAFLEEDWASKDNARLYEATVELCQKEGAPIPLYPIIPVKPDTTEGQINAALEAIGGNPPPPMVVYRVDSEEALKRLTEVLPKVK